MLETLVFIDVIETEGAVRVDIYKEDGDIFSHYVGRNVPGRAVLICQTDESITDSTARAWLKQLQMEDLIPFLAPETENDVCFDSKNHDYVQEMETFRHEQAKYQKKFPEGGFLAIKGSSIIGPFADHKDAQKNAADVFGAVPCLIKEIFDNNPL